MTEFDLMYWGFTLLIGMASLLAGDIVGRLLGRFCFAR